MLNLNKRPLNTETRTLEEFLEAAIPGLLEEERNGIDWYATANLDRVCNIAEKLYGEDGEEIYKILREKFNTAKDTLPDGSTFTERIAIWIEWERKLRAAFARVYGLENVLPRGGAYYTLAIPNGRLLRKLENRWDKWYTTEGRHLCLTRYRVGEADLDEEYLNGLLAELTVRANTETI